MTLPYQPGALLIILADNETWRKICSGDAHYVRKNGE
jgi:hypothetical protein